MEASIHRFDIWGGRIPLKLSKQDTEESVQSAMLLLGHIIRRRKHLRTGTVAPRRRLDGVGSVHTGINSTVHMGRAQRSRRTQTFSVAVLNRKAVEKMAEQRLIDANTFAEAWNQDSQIGKTMRAVIAEQPTIDPETLAVVRQLREELARVTAERDAAVEQLHGVDCRGGDLHVHGLRGFSLQLDDRGTVKCQSKTTRQRCRRRSPWQKSWARWLSTAQRAYNRTMMQAGLFQSLL